MFTGLVQNVGVLKKIDSKERDISICVEVPEIFLDGVNLGGSISVSGVCLTMTEKSRESFWADVSAETLKNTTIGDWGVGSKVNLEKSLTFSGPLGGHIVTGHVDGVGEILQRASEGRSYRFVLRIENHLSRYVARKGSICIDGTSLTVNSVVDTDFEVNIIPETMRATIFDTYRVGSRVNVEVDLIARYIERFAAYDQVV